jgi:hypothetical protein
MTRKNIFEILGETYDIENEFNVIKTLFFEPTLVYGPYLGEKSYIPIEHVVDNNLFFAWKQRYSCLNTVDLKQKLKLSFVSNGNLNNKILCLEYICNMIELINTKLSYPTYQKTKEFVILEKNIELFLEHINYEKLIIKDEEKVILVPKNPAATAVAEISSKDVAFAILKYHHASLKGQIEEKRKLLLSIANEYEPLLNKPIAGFKEYFDKATNMLNNMNIRHNNKSGKNKKELVAQMGDDELESWYDELYQLLLFCVLIKDNKERKDKVDDLLKRINVKPEKQ